MKPVVLVSTLLLAVAPLAGAVDLNKDAMKAMQQQGQNIVDESKDGRHYRAANGTCLDSKKSALVVNKCNDKTTSQKWKIDDKGRLLAHNGQCVAGIKLAKCGSAKNQKWKLDDKMRLVNQSKQCLEVPGKSPKAGTAVKTASCSKSKGQVWK
ncbi:MAG: RICIN domain-containing protein [Halioglobus sp.]